MKFWDASALLPLCVSEPRTPLLKSIAQEDAAIVAWWMTLIECFSAFARLRREGVLTRAEEDQARRVLNRLGDLWTEVQPGREIRDRAGRILLLHPLRAADSLQLAAALTWAHGNPTEQPFVCLDHRLRAAAQQEGFRVLPEM
ncbi:MAG: type II toxin-antitoxin system VapC family toxin [Candidatus Rokuibacteriota bacterium]